MASSVTAAYASSAALTAHRFSSNMVAEDGGRTAKDSAARKKSSATITDTVTLSPAAQAAVTAKPNSSVSYYSQFFPTRDGSPATALATAIVDPGAESISKGKTKEQVASAARASMDAKYKEMRDSGKPFDINSYEGKDWNSLMSDLDRRALYSVSSNQGGQFSKEEQDMAQSIMSQQQGWAMGLPSGPTRLVEGIPDPFNGGNAARMYSAVKWLDSVSNDEKASVPWAVSRATAQIFFEANVDRQNQTPENLDSESPMVKLIKSAMDTMKGNPERGVTTGLLTNKDDLKRQTWFQGFEDQLDDAQRRTEELYQRKG
jgi:hypothetical protein